MDFLLIYKKNQLTHPCIKLVHILVESQADQNDMDTMTKSSSLCLFATLINKALSEICFRSSNKVYRPNTYMCTELLLLFLYF